MTSLRVAVVTDCVEHVVPATRDTWHSVVCAVIADPRDAWPGYSALNKQHPRPGKNVQQSI